MNISYARSPLPKSIFLAGPTPRDAETKSWRPEALWILSVSCNFEGTVFVPEEGDGSAKFSYDDQIEWELQALHSATSILFWVPREMEHMPALTTNVEFGLFAARKNVVLGYPEDAFRMKYLKGIAKMYNLPVCHTLHDTCQLAVQQTNRPFQTS